MNERIRELVKQAGFFVLSNGKIYIPTTSEEITDCQIKFAELIIRECASIAATAEPWKSDDLILRHFGVEE